MFVWWLPAFLGAKIAGARKVIKKMYFYLVDAWLFVDLLCVNVCADDLGKKGRPTSSVVWKQGQIDSDFRTVDKFIKDFKFIKDLFYTGFIYTEDLLILRVYF